jgi:hypothetical protein
MKQPPPIPLAGSELRNSRHVCAFFNNDEEEYRALLPFIREGMERGDKAVHVVNPDQRADHVHRLAGAGIDPAAAEKDGQLDIRINTDVYLTNGRFDQDRMLRVFEDMVSNSTPRFPLHRIVCRMDWAAGEPIRVRNLIEFESRVNDVWSRHDDLVICTYRFSQFGGDAVMDILRTHPMVIIGGILHENPFFIPPEEFQHEFRGRHAIRAVSEAAD